MNNREMRKTVEMPVVETTAEIYAKDPLGIYSHRRDYCRGCGVEVVGDVWCQTCLDAEVAEAVAQPPDLHPRRT